MKRFMMLLAVLAIGFAATAQAGMIELRGGIGRNAADADAFEDEVNTASGGGLNSDDFENYFADLFVNIPAFPIGVGLRHEWINQDKSSGGNNFDLEAKNISVLVDWRIIDTVFYVGPILSIGYPTAEIDFKTPGVVFSDRIDSGKPSYSLGAEAGVKFSSFLVGAEAGYQSLELDDYQTSAGGQKVDVDLSGFYGKILVGVTFL